MCNSLEFLEVFVEHLRARGVDFVSMDELLGRLRSGDKRRFVAFTFDDGYKDNLLHVAPLFRRHKIPACIYVIPGLLDGEVTAWWHDLADLVEGTDQLNVTLRGKRFDFPTRTLLEKNKAYDAVAHFVRFEDQEGITTAVSHCFFERVSTISGKTFMDWHDIECLSREDWVTIGAHTMTHRTLNLLPSDEIWREISESRDRIQARVKKPVAHFSYPFGGRNSVDHHVFKIALDCGFKTMVTTRMANIFPQHRHHPYAWPRIVISGNNESLAAADIRMNGLESARLYRGRRVIIE